MREIGQIGSTHQRNVVPSLLPRLEPRTMQKAVGLKVGHRV